MAPVTSPAFPAVVHAVPKGAVYSILLLLHVACALVGFGALAMTGVQARRARRGPTGHGAEGVRRFFGPGVNWAARALYGVPVFGFALISTSDGAFSAGDGFVIAIKLVQYFSERRRNFRAAHLRKFCDLRRA